MTFVEALLAAFAVLVAGAMWRSGGKLLAALVEIARLPGVVDSLVSRLDDALALVDRVDRIEASLSLTPKESPA